MPASLPTSEAENELAQATKDKIESVLDNWFSAVKRKNFDILNHFRAQQLLHTKLEQVENELQCEKDLGDIISVPNEH